MCAKPLGIGTIGAGVIAVRSVYTHFIEPDMKDVGFLAAACDPVPGRAAAAAKEFGIKAAYESVDELVADPNVEVVSVCSPIGLHFEHGMKAIEAGKHVHFNKSISITADEATKMIDAAKANNVKLVASPGMMLWKVHREMRRALLEGRLGMPTWCICGISDVLFYHTFENGRQVEGKEDVILPTWYYKQPGGGPQYDCTVYAIQALTGVMGPVKRVAGFSGRLQPYFEFGGEKIESEIDDSTTLALDFGNALLGVAYASLKGGIVKGFSPAIYGTEGFMNGQELLGEDVSKLPRDIPLVNAVHQKLPENHVYGDLMQLINWVNGGAQPYGASAEQARHVVEIIEAGYEAAKTGKTVELKTTFEPLTLEQLDQI